MKARSRHTQTYHTLTVRFPPSLVAQAKRVGDRYGFSLNELAIDAMRDHIFRLENENERQGAAMTTEKSA